MKLKENCETVGCGADRPEPFSFQCTVTAHQSAELNFSALLIVEAEKFVYGDNNVLVLEHEAPEEIFSPSIADEVDTFAMACLPDMDFSSWLHLDAANGDITMTPNKAPKGNFGLTNLQGPGLNLHQGNGVLCQVTATRNMSSLKTIVHVLVPSAWKEVNWTIPEINHTLGELSPPISPKDSLPRNWSTAPDSFSASCASDADEAVFSFDVLTGQATLDGHEVFVMDVSTGIIVVTADVGLAFLLDAQEKNRHSINVTCAVFAHYDWLVTQRFMVGGVLSIQLQDNVCWNDWTHESTTSFWRNAEKVTLKEGTGCKSLCRSRADCSHFAATAGSCTFLSARCSLPDPHNIGYCQEYKAVTEKILNCSKGSTCIEFHNPGSHFFAGTYCPFSSDAEGNMVYKRDGITAQDTQYLATYRAMTDAIACDEGDLVLKRPSPDDIMSSIDNASQPQAELHGESVACLRTSIHTAFAEGWAPVQILHP